MSSAPNHGRRMLVSPYMWPHLPCCVVLVLTTQAGTANTLPRPGTTNRGDPLSTDQTNPPRPCQPWPKAQQCRHQIHRRSGFLQQRQSTTWSPSIIRGIVRGIRGGQRQGNGGDTNGANDRAAPEVQHGNNPAVEKIEKLAADLRAKRDNIAADVRARGEAIVAELKTKQEKIADEVLRERSPEVFGKLDGHHSYDSATAGLDVANRRSFFQGIRRVVLLVQVVEFIVACSWQAAFPYGGVAGFLAADHDQPARTSQWAGCLRDARGRLGLAVAVALGQAALYTILLVFFGCDRVVFRAVRVTGWEHGVAAAWALFRTFSAVGELHHVAASAWLAGVAFLCAYFGRKL